VGDVPERWVTADEVIEVRERYIAQMPGFRGPVAYSVARIVGDELTFAHVNEVGGTHLLPAAVLAFVCGHRSGNATYELTREQFAEAVRLAPAGACDAFDHPNLWSWRPLLASTTERSRFVAVFVDDLDVPPLGDRERAVRARLA